MGLSKFVIFREKYRFYWDLKVFYIIWDIFGHKKKRALIGSIA